jgi:hypothetical protein
MATNTSPPTGHMDHLHLFCQHEQLKNARRTLNLCIEGALQSLLFLLVQYMGTAATLTALEQLHSCLRALELESSKKAAFYGKNTYLRREHRSYTVPNPTTAASSIRILVEEMQATFERQSSRVETVTWQTYGNPEDGSHEYPDDNLVTKFFGFIPILPTVRGDLNREETRGPPEDRAPTTAEACVLDVTLPTRACTLTPYASGSPPPSHPFRGALPLNKERKIPQINGNAPKDSCWPNLSSSKPM